MFTHVYFVHEKMMGHYSDLSTDHIGTHFEPSKEVLWMAALFSFGDDFKDIQKKSFGCAFAQGD